MTNKNQDKVDDKLSAIPNIKYQKFFDKFTEIDTLDVSQWRVPHLLGYFCKKYKQTYGIDYSWKFNNQSPTKCFEVWQANTLAAKLSANPKILRDYIDWVYTNYVPKTKSRFRSISFITKDEIVNDYKLNVLLAGQKNLQIDRSTQLPPNYIEIMNEVYFGGVNITTYGDLAFLSQMDPMSDNLAKAMEKLAELGLDRDALKRIV